MNPRRLYDVTVPIDTNLAVWPGDPLVALDPVTRIDDGDDYNLSRLAMSMHTGTHVDAPWHFVESGSRLHDIPLDRWVGPCFVADLEGADALIEPAHLDAAHIPSDTLRLLLRTRNSDFWRSDAHTFIKHYVALSPAAAFWIVERGIRLVGIDYYSVDPFTDERHTVHHTLLGAGVLIVENIDLSAITPGPYDLFCLPLRLIGVDGAPARVILMDPA